MADTSLVSLWAQVISFKSVRTPREDKFLLYYKSHKWGLTRLCSLANNSFTNEHAVFLTHKKYFFFLLYQMYILLFCHNLCSYLFLYLNFKSPECIYYSHMFNLENTQPVFQIAFQVSPLSISLNSPSSQLWSPHLSLTLLLFRFSIFSPHVPILFPIASSLSISLCQWDMGVSRDWQLATDPISVTMETGSISR